MNNIKNWLLVIFFISTVILGYFLFSKEKEIIKIPITIEVPISGKTKTFPPVELPKPKKVKPRPIENIPEEKRDSLLADALIERDYEEIFEDSIQSIVVKSKVQGKLLKQQVRYNIYPDTIVVEKIVEVPINNKFKPSVYLGGDFNLNTESNLQFKPETSLVLKKSIISAGWEPPNILNPKGTWTIGYKIKIF